MKHCDTYLTESIQLLQRIDPYRLAAMVDILVEVKRNKGRVFCLGVGGSAATASHAVNDLRKICGIEAYAPTDNVSELTARTNDEGWRNTFGEYLSVSRLSDKDAVWVFSVGGGKENTEWGGASNGVSENICEAADYATDVGAMVVGIVGRNGGYTAEHWHAGIIIEPNYPDRITPHTEGLAGVLLHCIVSHPALSEEIADAGPARAPEYVNRPAVPTEVRVPAHIAGFTVKRDLDKPPAPEPSEAPGPGYSAEDDCRATSFHGRMWDEQKKCVSSAGFIFMLARDFARVRAEGYAAGLEAAAKEVERLGEPALKLAEARAKLPGRQDGFTLDSNADAHRYASLASAVRALSKREGR